MGSHDLTVCQNSFKIIGTIQCEMVLLKITCSDAQGIDLNKAGAVLAAGGNVWNQTISICSTDKKIIFNLFSGLECLEDAYFVNKCIVSVN